MSYEFYKRIKSFEEYFSNPSAIGFNETSAEIKAHIYKNYLVKCTVFKRDNYKCQNVGCKDPFCKLTIHHVKAKQYGGSYKEDNLVTACLDCHQDYETKAQPLVFADISSLPAHMRGQTYLIHKEDKVDWKMIRAEMRKRRKNVRDQWTTLTMADWKLLIMLWKFLERNYTEIHDDL